MRSKPTDETVARAEQFISYGSPTCDRCWDLAPSERPDDGEFWPEHPITYLNGDERSAHKFLGLTVCEHHDPIEPPAGSTHRVVFGLERARDHHMKTAIRRTATDIEAL